MGQQNLSPLASPEWEELDVGIAKYRPPGPLPLYYDFFHFPNGTYALLIAEPIKDRLDALLYLAAVRGMIRSLMHEVETATKGVFLPINFIEKLNRMLANDAMGQHFSLSLLHLDPFRDQLIMISCGDGLLFHLPQGSLHPRTLTSNNPQLGVDPKATFLETTDNWNVGDTLILPSSLLEGKWDPALEKILSESIAQNAALSAQRQADTLFRSLSSEAPKLPKLLLATQRIA